MRSRAKLTRRELIKRFGAAAFVLSPVARAMGYMAAEDFANAPRFIMFFKGGSFHPRSTRPRSITDLTATPIAPLQPHAQDIVLFQGMRIHGGEPQSDDYQEEHGAGLMGCMTGDRYRYSRNDSYFAYTDNPSIDVAIAEHYQQRPGLSALPFASLHLGVGAHSDADNVGLGQRYISFRKRRSGDAQYDNAIEPVQDTGQVYDMLMERVQLLCAQQSRQPLGAADEMQATLQRRKSLLDFRLQEIQDAKRQLGLDSEHAQKLDGLLEGWRSVERSVAGQMDAAAGGAARSTQSCPTGDRPSGRANNILDCDRLSPIHDQMIDLVQLAFAWDLTRVVAYTCSGASSGQRMPSRGVREAHHTLEHSNNVEGLNIMGTFYAEKFARLLTALKAIDDGNGETALYNSAVVLGMECWSDSASGHYLTDIPFILAGQGGGRFDTGRIVDANRRNNNDLLISVQNACGIESEVFGMRELCSGPIV